jgi:predicted signal transduction protein with EAL and GGDEF domain
MSRDQALSYAAVCGVAGLVLVATGTALASALVFYAPLWLAVLPALLVWLGCGYLGMKQFARGIYEVVDEASTA